MEQLMTTDELLRDFRSIKLPKKTREWIEQLRLYFETNGEIPTKDRFSLIRLSKRYSRQFVELHESRERARTTNGLRKLGMTKQEQEDRCQERLKREKVEAADVGF